MKPTLVTLCAMIALALNWEEKPWLKPPPKIQTITGSFALLAVEDGRNTLSVRQSSEAPSGI